MSQNPLIPTKEDSDEDNEDAKSTHSDEEEGKTPTKTTPRTKLLYQMKVMLKKNPKGF